MNRLLGVVVLLGVAAPVSAKTVTIAFDITTRVPAPDPLSPIGPPLYSGVGTFTFVERDLSDALLDVTFGPQATRTVYSTAVSYTYDVGPFSRSFNFPVAYAEVWTRNPTPGLNFINFTTWNPLSPPDPTMSPIPPMPFAFASWPDFPTGRELSAEHMQRIGPQFLDPIGSYQLANFREVVPVPEPSEWAMIGLGLAIVGRVAQRRGR